MTAECIPMVKTVFTHLQACNAYLRSAIQTYIFPPFIHSTNQNDNLNVSLPTLLLSGLKLQYLTVISDTLAGVTTSRVSEDNGDTSFWENNIDLDALFNSKKSEQDRRFEEKVYF